jgi:hypothetical protein
MRAIMAFSVARYFTPLIMILGFMLADLVKFLVISGFSFFLWCAVGNILLNKSEGYNSIGRAMKSLFGAALGGFEFDEFDELDYPVIGQLFLAAYLIFMMITLLNFIIAILSDTYANNQEKGTALYLREVILLDSKLGHSETDTWRVSAFVPLNLFIHFIAVPLSFCANTWKAKKEMNYKLMKICFFPLYLFGLIISLLAGILHVSYLVFVGYIDYIKFKFTGDQTKGGKGKTLGLAIVLIIFFPFIVLALVLVNLVKYTWKAAETFLFYLKKHYELRVNKLVYRQVTQEEFMSYTHILKNIQREHLKHKCENSFSPLNCYIPTAEVIRIF